MTDEEHTRCPGCNRMLGHEPDCPMLALAAKADPEGPDRECIDYTDAEEALWQRDQAAAETPMYAISGAALDRITDWINCDIEQTENYDEVIALIRAARENGPIPDRLVQYMLLKGEQDRAAYDEFPEMAPGVGPQRDIEAELRSASAERRVADQQRAYLLAQVGSLILRLAGEKVAAGLLDLPAASVYADRERAIINAGLAQIGEPNKEG